MKNSKFEQKKRHKRRTFGNKTIVLMLAMVLLAGCVVGGTVAWLTAKTTPVNNVFTTSNIEITLGEDATEFKMIPGWTIEKDPVVTVESGSESCYLFVEVTESTHLKLADYIKYAVDTAKDTETVNGVVHGGWTQGDGTAIPENVYYRRVLASETDQAFAILGSGTYCFDNGTPADNTDDKYYEWADDQVLTKPDVTMEMMNAVTSENQPKLSFTAYAVQLYKSRGIEFTAEQAWAEIRTN